jgi:hypothetical protein
MQKELLYTAAAQHLKAFLEASATGDSDLSATVGGDPRAVADALRGEASPETWEAITRGAASLPAAARAPDELRELWLLVLPGEPLPEGVLGTAGPPPEDASRLPRAAAGVFLVAGILATTGVLLVDHGQRLPSLVVDGEQQARHPQGSTFQFEARGLQPLGEVSRYCRRPTSATPVERVTRMRADSKGNLRFSLTPSCKTRDTVYHIKIVDHQTGAETNEVEATVVANPNCTSVDRVMRDKSRVGPGE